MEIHNLHIAPHKSDEWGEDILGKDTLGDGETLKITFPLSEKAAHWDFRASYCWTKRAATPSLLGESSESAGDPDPVTLHLKDIWQSLAADLE